MEPVAETNAGRLNEGNDTRPVAAIPAEVTNKGAFMLVNDMLVPIAKESTAKLVKAGKLMLVKTVFPVMFANALSGIDVKLGNDKVSKLVCPLIKYPAIVESGKNVRLSKPGKFRELVL